MYFKALILLFLCGPTWAEDSFRPPARMRIQAALRALAKADSIQVTGQATYKDAEGGMTNVPIKKEIRSRAAIARLSQLLTSQKWELAARVDFVTGPWKNTYVRMISYEKGRKADEFKLVGSNVLTHPWLGAFRNDMATISTNFGEQNSEAFDLILKAE